MSDMEVYNEAKKIYNMPGAPVPDVEINFYAEAEKKKECLQAYTTEQNSIRKIWPYYNWYPYWIYFRIFDRDFFRVVDVSKL
jgi:murein endopeptidase